MEAHKGQWSRGPSVGRALDRLTVATKRLCRDSIGLVLAEEARGCGPPPFCALILARRVPLMARVVDGRRLTTAGRSTTAGIRPRRMPTVAVIWRHEISATDISATDSAGRWIVAFAAAFPCRDPGIHGVAAFAWWRRLRWRRPLRARRSGAPSARWSATALLRTRRCGRRG